MSSYNSNATYGRLAARIRAARDVLLVAHAKPDGDALGSMLAMHQALEALAVRSTILLMGPLERALVDAAGDTPLRRLEVDGLPREEPDLVLVVDTGSWSQLEPVAAWLRERADRIIGVDHHVQGNSVAGERIVDPACASTTQALMPLLDELDVRLSPTLATPLFMGLATDTGWFRFSNADAAVFALASRLLAAGADKEWLFATLEQNARPSRLALTGRALASLELCAAGRAALMVLRREDFAETGGGPEDIGGLVNEPLVIRGVRVAALISQSEPNVTRLSLRSKPAASGVAPEHVFDVNLLAAQFGGGGHRHAAGAKLAVDIDEARRRVTAALDAL